MTPLQCLLQHLPARGNGLYPLGAGWLTLPPEQSPGAGPVGILRTIPRGRETRTFPQYHPQRPGI